MTFARHGPVQSQAHRLRFRRQQGAQIKSGRRIHRRLRHDRSARPGTRLRRPLRRGMRLDPPGIVAGELQRLLDRSCDLLGSLGVEEAPAGQLRQACRPRQVVGLQREADDVHRDPRGAQLLGADTHILLAVVGIVVDQHQAALARCRRQRLGRFANGERQRAPASRVQLLQRLEKTRHIDGLGRAHRLDIGAIAAAVAEGSKPDARLAADLAQRASHGVSCNHQLAGACAIDIAPHRGGAVEDNDHRGRLIAMRGRGAKDAKEHGQCQRPPTPAIPIAHRQPASTPAWTQAKNIVLANELV